MVRALATITFLVLSLDLLWAQQSFLKYYGSAGTFRYNLFELNSGNIIVSFAPLSTGMSLLDPQGNLLHTQGYTIDTNSVIQAIGRYSDNEFAFTTGYERGSCLVEEPDGYSPLIGRMDSLGNAYDIHYYDMNAQCHAYLCRDIEVTTTNKVIAWGLETFFALCVDPAGAVVWAKWFDHEGSFGFCKELPGGDFIAGINMDTAGVAVARLDPQGNFLWCKSYIRPRGVVSDCLVESDDSFVITGYTDSTNWDFLTPLPTTYHPKLFMMKLDGDGDVQWCKGFDSGPYLWYSFSGPRIVATTDNNYAVLATLGVENYNIGYRPFLMKTDQNGDTLWTRSAGRLNHIYDTKDLLASADGGYMYSVNGYTLGKGIFKTDPQGYLPCYNRWHQVVVSDLFPTDSSFTLSSIDGATAHPAYLTDTITDPLEVTDPCSTSTGMPPSRIGGFRVRPNPNAGRFTVEFTDPLMAESYYSVYDAVGKLLYQRPLRTGATVEEIDLSRFGKGSYMIRITDPQGQRHERVVVE